MGSMIYETDRSFIKSAKKKKRSKNPKLTKNLPYLEIYKQKQLGSLNNSIEIKENKVKQNNVNSSLNNPLPSTDLNSSNLKMYDFN